VACYYNIANAKTRRAYKADVRDFVTHAGLGSYAELRAVVRAHVIDWRKDMEGRALGPATIRRKLSALASLFDYLCERNAVAGNPVEGVKRRWPTATKAARRRSAMRRQGGCSMRRRPTR
jgi:site-specific recombinase XerD